MVLQYLNCFGYGQFNKWRKGNKRILNILTRGGRGKGGGGLTTQLRSTSSSTHSSYSSQEFYTLDCKWQYLTFFLNSSNIQTSNDFFTCFCHSQFSKTINKNSKFSFSLGRKIGALNLLEDTLIELNLGLFDQ
jgi:hypothetical protein